LFVTLPRETHSTGAHPEARGVLYWLLLSVPAKRNALLGLPARESRALFDRLLNLPRRQFRAPDSVKPTLHRIFEIGTGTKDALQTIELRNLLVRFLLDVVAGSAATTATTYSPSISTALRHMEAHLAEPLALPELAARAGLSLSRFKTRFKEETGIPPSDYLMRLRVVAAARLLYEKQLSVTEVAMRLGFSSSQYFATVFKSYTRHSPASARQTHVRIS
jgi:AraC-like DNA-binding protein